MTSCATHGRIYDSFYNDYHEWAAETPYYTQLERDTRREHKDFSKCSAVEQKEYWDWRHHQNDRR